MIEFKADRIKVSGPKIDGSYTIVFEVGEYEQKKVAELLKLPQMTILSITVESEKPS